MRIALFAILGFLNFSMTLASYAADHLQMMNSYVSMKLHLDSNPNRGQMVGAAWIRIRNNTDSPLGQIPYILNPGLQVTKILGPNNQPLNDISNITTISGYSALDATVGTITLSSAVKPDSDIEIVIQYRGLIQNLSWTAIDHAKETLSSDFTVLRSDSFGYPVIAEPNKAAIEAAQKQAPYYQTATIEMAGGYKIAGNLHVDEMTPKGSKVSFGLKYSQPTAPMILPIARYKQITDGPITISVFSGEQNTATNLMSALSPDVTRLTALLGAPTSGKLNITMVPDGYGSTSTMGLVMLEQSTFTAGAKQASKALLHLWGIGAPQAAGHWRNSLNKIIKLSVTGGDLSAHANILFTNLKTQVSADKKLKKATLVSLTEAGKNSEAEALSGLTLIGLHDIMGQEAFFGFIRQLRSELRGNYADNIAFSDFILDELKHKKAKKFAKNWLKGKKIDKDMKKADSFKAVISRYK